jgi:hypothetical protein
MKSSADLVGTHGFVVLYGTITGFNDPALPGTNSGVSTPRLNRWDTPTPYTDPRVGGRERLRRRDHSSLHKRCPASRDATPA